MGADLRAAPFNDANGSARGAETSANGTGIAAKTAIVASVVSAFITTSARAGRLAEVMRIRQSMKPGK